MPDDCLQPFLTLQNHMPAARIRILMGEVDVIIDGVVNHLTPGQLIHIEPGEIHYVRNPYDKPVKMISTLAPFTDPDKVDVENYTW